MVDFLNNLNNQAPAPAQEQANFNNTDIPKKKSWYNRPKFIIILLIFILVIVYFNRPRGEVEGEKVDNAPREVKAVTLDSQARNADEIKISGVVKADTKVDVVALAKGTVRSLNFETGDEVGANKILASLYDNTSLASLANAQTNFSNTQQSYTSTTRLADESVRQAAQAVNNAEIGLKTAEDNLANAEELQRISKEDTFSNATIAYAGFLNTINNSLNQVNQVIGIELNNKFQYDPRRITPTLGINNGWSLNNADNSYKNAKNFYNNLNNNEINANNAISNYRQLLQLFNMTKAVADNVISVLDNTITTIEFNATDLNLQKSSFASLRATIVNSTAAAQGTLQGLENIDSIQKRELDSLRNAAEIAASQLEQARIGYQNALEGKNQQLISARTALDASRGQLSIVQTQVADLTVKAPISGIITRKLVELGSEVNPGQKIAEISQTALVKIIIELTSDDIYRIGLGDVVIINNKLEGVISQIDPAADPISKKVKVEIAFNNAGKDLIPETFVDISIPVDGAGRSEFSEGRFWVPLKAVTITQTEKYVFLVKTSEDDNNIAKKTAIEIGETEGDKVEIVSGLQDGDVLITEGNRGLEGDEELKIQN